MKNYVVRFGSSDQDKVLRLIRGFSNDIEIDRVESNQIGITIELEDKEADELYENLRTEIERHNLVINQ